MSALQTQMKTSTVTPGNGNDMSKITSDGDPQAFMQALTVAGAPFEMRTMDIQGYPRRVFCNGPQSLADVYRIAATFGERTMISCDGRQMSYAEVLGKAAALGQHLKRLMGRQEMQGQRIAIVMSNRPEWMISFIAITAMGATAVMVNSRGTAAELRDGLDETGTSWVLADERRAELMLAGGHSQTMIVVSDSGAARPDWIDFSQATEGWKQAVLEPACMQPEDDAVIMFTSGTTGRSKATLFKQRAVITALMHIQFSGAVVAEKIMARRGASFFSKAPSRQSASLLAFPLFHVSGCYAVFLASLLHGSKIVLLAKWNAATALELIEREHVSAFAGAPAMYWDMLRLDRGGRAFQSLLSIGAGGQVFAPKLLKDMASAFPDAILGIGYGLTECGGTICAVAGDDLASNLTAAGRVLPSVDIKIVDEAGEEVALGAEGEICIGGAMLMTEYCRRAQATADIMQGGWLKSGDLGRLDAKGYLHVVDRKKNIVISGGENISCSELECVLVEHEGVEDAAAFGVADERLGEKLVMAVVLQAQARVSEQSLIAFLQKRLAAYKIPQQFVFIAQLPRNASGKVLRQELKATVKL